MARVVLSEKDVAQVQQCLDLLQSAQSLVNQAGEALCPVRGFGDEWSDLGKPHDAIKKQWHAVNSRLSGLLQAAKREVAHAS